jgi:hypothetical protein
MRVGRFPIPPLRRHMPRICLLHESDAQALLANESLPPCDSDHHGHTSRSKAEARVQAGVLAWIDGDKTMAVHCSKERQVRRQARDAWQIQCERSPNGGIGIGTMQYRP